MVVYESESLRAVYVPSRDFSLLGITFVPWLAAPSIRADGFSEAFLRKNAISALHVTCATNAWYQYADMVALAVRVRRLCNNFSNVVTYGQSMGGYAALQFLDLLRPARVLAYAPQYSVDPALVPFERRWTTEAATIDFKHRGMSRWSAAKVQVFYDPRTEDVRHVDLIRRDLGSIETVPVPYCGHAIPRALQQMGLLAKTTLDVLRGSFSQAGFRAAYRTRRHHSALYWSNLSRSGRSLSWRIAICRQALRIAPEDIAQKDALAQLLLQAGDLAGAEAAAREVLAQRPDCQSSQRTLCVILRKAGRPGAALAVLARSMGDGTAEDATCRFYADTAAELGFLAEAEEALRRAIVMAPAVHRSHFLLSRILTRLHRRDEALKLARQALEMAPGDTAYQRAVAELAH